MGYQRACTSGLGVQSECGRAGRGLGEAGSPRGRSPRDTGQNFLQGIHGEEKGESRQTAGGLPQTALRSWSSIRLLSQGMETPGASGSLFSASRKSLSRTGSLTPPSAYLPWFSSLHRDTVPLTQQGVAVTLRQT